MKLHDTLSRRVHLLVFCFISMIAFLFSSPAFGKDLYVNSSTGSDSYTWAQNDSSHPWATLTRACVLAVAGDTVYVLPGTYTGTASGGRLTPAFNPTNNGTSENNRITFVGTSGVVLRTTGGMGPIIGTYGKSYITWKNFTLDENNYTPSTGDTAPAVIWNSSHITIDNVDITGRLFTAGSGALHSAIRLEDASYAVVRNCKLHGMTTSSEVAQNTNGIMTYRTYHSVFENNEVYDTYAGIFIKSTNDNNVVRYNYLHDLMRQGISIYSETTNTRIYQNIVVNAFIGLFSNSSTSNANTYFYNNTIVNSNGVGYGGITAKYCATGPVTYYNNIVYGGYYAAVFDEGTPFSTPIYFHHNNYYGYSQTPNGWRNMSYGGAMSFGTWQLNVGGGDSSSILTDPLFVNVSTRDFRLQPGSPARTASDTGGAIGAYITGTETIVLPVVPPMEGSTSSGGGGGGGCSITGTKVDSVNSSGIVYLWLLIAPAILLFVRKL